MAISDAALATAHETIRRALGVADDKAAHLEVLVRIGKPDAALLAGRSAVDAVAKALASNGKDGLADHAQEILEQGGFDPLPRGIVYRAANSLAATITDQSRIDKGE